MSAKVAILGSGNIGTDLLVKATRSPHLECVLFAGRSTDSPGIAFAKKMGVQVSADGLRSIQNSDQKIDLVFDATSAQAHAEHAPILKKLGIQTIDLTPARVGDMCVPAVNLSESLGSDNVNMVTCGGQASAPIAHALGASQQEIDYIEVISSIASKSAGPATRANLDEYLHTTEEAILRFSGAARAKAILNLNPAQPCVDMQTTVFCKCPEPDLKKLSQILDPILARIQSYVPGYQVIVGPTVENGRIVVMVRVRGLGDYLPSYAGNLDIINCAAIAAAEEHARCLAQQSH